MTGKPKRNFCIFKTNQKKRKFCLPRGCSHKRLGWGASSLGQLIKTGLGHQCWQAPPHFLFSEGRRAWQTIAWPSPLPKRHPLTGLWTRRQTLCAFRKTNRRPGALSALRSRSWTHQVLHEALPALRGDDTQVRLADVRGQWVAVWGRRRG